MTAAGTTGVAAAACVCVADALGFGILTAPQTSKEANQAAARHKICGESIDLPQLLHPSCDIRWGQIWTSTRQQLRRQQSVLDDLEGLGYVQILSLLGIVCGLGGPELWI